MTLGGELFEKLQSNNSNPGPTSTSPKLIDTRSFNPNCVACQAQVNLKRHNSHCKIGFEHMYIFSRGVCSFKPQTTFPPRAKT